jgi:hypothetical protein
MDQTGGSIEHKIGQSADSRAALISKLLQVADFYEAYHESNFRCYRRDKQGKNQEVIVTIYDAGKGLDVTRRYLCIARTNSGKSVTGEPAQFVDSAIENVKWNDLDL